MPIGSSGASPGSPPGDVLSVEFALTEDDVVAGQLAMIGASATLRRSQRSVYLLPLACAIALGLLWGLDVVPLETFATLAVSILVFSWLLILAVRQRQRKLLRGLLREGRNAGLLGPQLLTVSPEGLTCRGEFGHSTRYWSGVERIEQRGQYVLFYVSSHSAHIVPEGAFRDAAELDRFVALARRYAGQLVASSAPGN